MHSLRLNNIHSMICYGYTVNDFSSRFYFLYSSFGCCILVNSKWPVFMCPIADWKTTTTTTLWCMSWLNRTLNNNNDKTLKNIIHLMAQMNEMQSFVSISVSLFSMPHNKKRKDCQFGKLKLHLQMFMLVNWIAESITTIHPSIRSIRKKNMTITQNISWPITWFKIIQ